MKLFSRKSNGTFTRTNRVARSELTQERGDLAYSEEWDAPQPSHIKTDDRDLPESMLATSTAAQAEDDGVPALPTKKKQRTKRRKQKIVARILFVVFLLELLYSIAVFSNIPFIKKWRDIYISTAMNTAYHQWLATKFIPASVIQEVLDREEAALQAQKGLISKWTDPHATTPSTEPEATEPEETESPISKEEREFFELFWELDRESWDSYLSKHPDTLKNGWENIKINEAGLDDDGTDIYTTMGEQVLAIDAKNQILIVRVKGDNYRGVLAIAKDPSRLSCHPSKSIGYYGQFAGVIAENNNGILAMTASGFHDPGGVGNGGSIAGYAMCDGAEYGYHMRSGYKRIELREDDRLYITDAYLDVTPGTTDAVEFSPALIVDGVLRSDEVQAWSGIQPRASIGQSDKYEILMLVIEGRLKDSLGAPVEECANILLKHNCMQAMNLDGGTSAIMWYDGEYINRCSNPACPSGRPLPNAWVYAKAD